MTPNQEKKREKIVRGMKRNKAALQKRYGDRWKEVMYATATKNVTEVSKKTLGNYLNKAGAQITDISLDNDDTKGIDKDNIRRKRSKGIKTAMGKIQKEDLEESKSGTGYTLYHKDFSSAMKHAYDFAKKKHKIDIHPDEIDRKVAMGPKRPSEGKTNSYRLKGDKGAIHVQVYNKGGSHPYELNMYKEEFELEEGLDLKNRLKRSRLMKRLAPKLARMRNIKRKKMASKEVLLKRAHKVARSMLRKRLAGDRGKNYKELSASGKIAVDRLLDGKDKVVSTIAKRIMPKVRQGEMDRLKRARGVKEALFEVARNSSVIIMKHPSKDHSVTARRSGDHVVMRFKAGTEITNVVKKKAMDAHNHLKGLGLRGWKLVEEHGAGEFGTDELTNRYKADTPGQEGATTITGPSVPYIELSARHQEAVTEMIKQGATEEEICEKCRVSKEDISQIRKKMEK